MTNINDLTDNFNNTLTITSPVNPGSDWEERVVEVYRSLATIDTSFVDDEGMRSHLSDAQLNQWFETVRRVYHNFPFILDDPWLSSKWCEVPALSHTLRMRVEAPEWYLSFCSFACLYDFIGHKTVLEIKRKHVTTSERLIKHVRHDYGDVIADMVSGDKALTFPLFFALYREAFGSPIILRIDVSYYQAYVIDNTHIHFTYAENKTRNLIYRPSPKLHCLEWSDIWTTEPLHHGGTIEGT